MAKVQKVIQQFYLLKDLSCLKSVRELNAHREIQNPYSDSKGFLSVRVD